MKLKGRNLQVAMNGIVIAQSKSCTLDIKTKTKDTAFGLSGQWKKILADMMSWSVKVSGLMDDYSDMNDTIYRLNSVMLSRLRVSIRVHIDGAGYYQGDAYLTALTEAGSVKQYATYNATFTGTDALSLSATAPNPPTVTAEELKAVLNSLGKTHYQFIARTPSLQTLYNSERWTVSLHQIADAVNFYFPNVIASIPDGEFLTLVAPSAIYCGKYGDASRALVIRTMSSPLRPDATATLPNAQLIFSELKEEGLFAQTIRFYFEYPYKDTAIVRTYDQPVLINSGHPFPFDSVPAPSWDLIIDNSTTHSSSYGEWQRIYWWLETLDAQIKVKTHFIHNGIEYYASGIAFTLAGQERDFRDLEYSAMYEYLTVPASYINAHYPPEAIRQAYDRAIDLLVEIFYTQPSGESVVKAQRIRYILSPRP